MFRSQKYYSINVIVLKVNHYVYIYGTYAIEIKNGMLSTNCLTFNNNGEGECTLFRPSTAYSLHSYPLGLKPKEWAFFTS